MSEDEIIGLKSTSIKFKKNIKLFVFINYLITSGLLIFLFRENIGANFSSFLVAIFSMSLIYQIFKFNKFNPKSCLTCFKINNLFRINFIFFNLYNLISMDFKELKTCTKKTI